jgi:Fe-Mn family superoxide dismutase
LKLNVQQLINWSEWGRQWIDYLQRKAELPHGAEQDLHRFAAAFTDIGRRAASFQLPESEVEFAHLTAKAEEIQRNFHKFLRLVHEYQSGERYEQLERREAVPIGRPVPIGRHTLPELPYSYDALEPYIDAETMRIHHDILHRNYVNDLNTAEKMMAQARKDDDFDLIKHWERQAAFNGAGHYLHTIFWEIMSPDGGGLPQGELADQIDRDFGSFEAFRRHFSKAAEKVEGGGWALFVWSPRAQHTEILQAEKHQNLTQWESIPLLVLDVWEHSYFLKYQSERPKYIEAFWNVVCWPHVSERYQQARRLRWQPY